MTRKSMLPLAMAVVSLACAACFVLMPTAQAVAQEQSGGGEVAMDKAPTISLPLGQSRIVRTPWPIKRVEVTDVKVAKVKELTKDRVLLMSVGVGSTTLLAWNDAEEARQVVVEVKVDVAYVRAELARLMPLSKLDVTQSGDVVVVTGVLARAEQAAQMRRYLDACKLKYVDLTTVAGVQQVQIQVRMAEVSRTAIKALGINWVANGSDVFGGSLIGPDQGQPINPISSVPFAFAQGTLINPSVTLFAGIPAADLLFFIQALAENQYLRILAEPTLVALSGEDASFLAGGEYPVPVPQSNSGNSSTITIEYKEYGIRLRFRPTVLGDGTIRLHVAPEVSELSDANSVTLNNFIVKSIVTRKAETTLELKSGQTFAMAGLISQAVNARNSRVPGVGDIPVLGTIFRSSRYTSGETELVVLVSASLAEPMTTAGMPPTPGDLHEAPNDWEFYGMGRIEGKAPASLSREASAWLKDNGLNRLRGPGAWATPQSPAVPLRPTEGESPSGAAAPATQPAGK